MFEFFDQVVGFFEFLMTMFRNALEAVLLIYGLLDAFILGTPSVLSSIFTLMPTFIGLSFLVVIAIAVVKMIIGLISGIVGAVV